MQKKTSSYTARFTATETLYSLFHSQSSVKILFDRNVKKYNLPARERNLAMNLIYGVLRQRQYLDRILQELSKTPIRKLDSFVHQTLAVGLYQIFFLDRIPHSAAVNEAVNSCRAKGIPKRLHGFVNGILRESIRRKENSSLAQRALTDKNGLPVYNHPRWLVDRWINHFGQKETARICAENSREPLLVLRVNTTLISAADFSRLLEQENIAHQPGSYCPASIVLEQFHGSIKAIPGFQQGFFQVQDQAAQLATSLLAPFKKGGTYLDGCAGLGGKTSHLLQLGVPYDLKIYAVEPEQHRLQKLMENQLRLSPGSHLFIHQENLEDFAGKNILQFDGILIDAPCSGTGVIGRHPDIRWNRREQDLSRYSERQLQLLEQAAEMLAPKGVLVYSTCSMEPEENQDVIRTFLANHPDFTLTDCAEHIPKATRPFVKNNFFCPRPSPTIDGFFAARMERA